MQNLVIVGAGGFGREVAAMIQDRFTEEYNLLGFVDDGLAVQSFVGNIPVLGPISWLQHPIRRLQVVIAIADPHQRQYIYEGLKDNVKLYFPSLIHPKARLHNTISIVIGKGSIITDSCILTCDVEIGNFSILNLACTIGHDVRIGNFVSLMPAVHLSGAVHIEDRAYLGTSATVLPGIFIGADTIVGAGAVVTKSIRRMSKVKGIPARAYG